LSGLLDQSPAARYGTVIDPFAQRGEIVAAHIFLRKNSSKHFKEKLLALILKAFIIYSVQTCDNNQMALFLCFTLYFHYLRYI
jgi:hypothetical protein